MEPSKVKNWYPFLLYKTRVTDKKKENQVQRFEVVLGFEHLLKETQCDGNINCNDLALIQTFLLQNGLNFN